MPAPLYYIIHTLKQKKSCADSLLLYQLFFFLLRQQYISVEYMVNRKKRNGKRGNVIRRDRMIKIIMHRLTRLNTVIAVISFSL